MLRFAPERAVVFTLVALAVLTGVVSAACRGEAPQDVLVCFSEAYSDRDIATLESVLAPDYIWIAVSPPEAEVFSRATSVAASLEMFADPEVESVSLQFDEGYRVVQGAEAKTWRIEDLRATLTLKRSSMAKPAVAPLCVTLYVRETTGDDPGYEVFREVFFEDEGCLGK